MIRALWRLCYKRSGLHCLIGSHVPMRLMIGGFRCARCHKTGADLDDMGFYGQGYARPFRKVYSRDNGGTVTRTDSWTPSDHGWALALLALTCSGCAVRQVTWEDYAWTAGGFLAGFSLALLLAFALWRTRGCDRCGAWADATAFRCRACGNVEDA